MIGIPRPGRFPSRFWLLPLAGIQAGLVAALLHARGGALLDDAYISFRYAARWAAGHGLTWNNGPAVEGFSNPLWTLLLGGLARLGIPPDLAAPWLGGLAFLALPAVLLALGRRRRLPPAALAVLAGGAGLDVGLVVWAGSGLETASAALLVAWWLVLAAGLAAGRPGLREGVALGLVGALLALSRPEGGMWALWGWIWLIWGAWAPGPVLWGWVLGMLPAGGYLLFRILTYGRLLPNTFYAKLEPDMLGLGHALSDLGGWLLAHGVLLAATLALVIRRRRRRGGRGPEDEAPPETGRWLILPAGWLLLETGFVLVAGGDWMGRTRYLAPVLPALYLLLAEGWRPARGLRVERRGAVAVLLGLHLAVGWGVRDRIPDYTRVGKQIGEWLRGTAAPDDTVAVTAAGAIPYYSGLPAYDVLGINDRAVAGRTPRHTGAWMPGHHRYDLDALLAVRPTWIVWDLGVRVNQHRLRKYRGYGGDPDSLGFREALLARPEFDHLYTVDPNTPPSTRSAYTVFRRR